MKIRKPLQLAVSVLLVLSLSSMASYYFQFDKTSIMFLTEDHFSNGIEIGGSNGG